MRKEPYAVGSSAEAARTALGAAPRRPAGGDLEDPLADPRTIRLRRRPATINQLGSEGMRLLFLAPGGRRGVQDSPRMDRLRERSPGLHRFLTTQESPYPFLRDVAIGGLVILLVLSSLWMYTGRWGSSPVVVVESGSMMHCSNGIGVSLGRDCAS